MYKKVILNKKSSYDFKLSFINRGNLIIILDGDQVHASKYYKTENGALRAIKRYLNVAGYKDVEVLGTKTI